MAHGRHFAADVLGLGDVAAQIGQQRGKLFLMGPGFVDMLAQAGRQLGILILERVGAPGEHRLAVLGKGMRLL